MLPAGRVLRGVAFLQVFHFEGSRLCHGERGSSPADAGTGCRGGWCVWRAEFRGQPAEEACLPGGAAGFRFPGSHAPGVWPHGQGNQLAAKPGQFGKQLLRGGVPAGGVSHLRHGHRSQQGVPFGVCCAPQKPGKRPVHLVVRGGGIPPVAGGGAAQGRLCGVHEGERPH